MLTVYSPYGELAPSMRTRVTAWLERTGRPATVHSYLDLANNRPKTMLRHPLEVVRTEAQLFRPPVVPGTTVLIHREVSPLSGGRLERQVLRRASSSVYDFDDALMWLPKAGYARLFSHARSCEVAVSMADRVMAGSEVLAEWASALNQDVRLIPTCVEPDSYKTKTSYDIAGYPRLVWIGTPSTEKYLKLLEPSLHQVHRLKGARLTVISASPTPLPDDPSYLDRVAWRPGIEAELGEFDIAVAPLLDSPIERGKCAYKVLQYAAAGLPAVVSPVGANAIVASRMGFAVANGTQEWTEALIDLINSDPQQRARLGQSALERVRLHYSYSAWQEEWLAAVCDWN